MKSCVLGVLLGAALLWAAQGLDIFKNGAEVAAYRTSQPCFGEIKEGTTVLIFSPETVARSTRLKIADTAKTPAADRIQVIAFGRQLKFRAGLEDYTAMTSVLSATGFALGRDPYYPLKISLSVADWSGSLYHQLLTDGKGAKRVIHSYTETDGDKADYIAEPAEECFYEDGLWVMVREFNGIVLKMGQKKECRILPSLWTARITGKPLVFEPGMIEKKKGRRHMVGNAIRTSTLWIWKAGERTVECWVDVNYPHVILEWKDSEGGAGQLLKQPVVTPYWEKRLNQDAALRRQIGIDR